MQNKTKRVIKIFLMLFFLVISSFSTTKAVSVSNFKPISTKEMTVGHTATGSWNGGSFFESITYEYTGYNSASKKGNYRFRYYITQSGTSSSYIYQNIDVAVYVDGIRYSTFYANPSIHISNTCRFMGEVTIPLTEGKHKVELKDVTNGGITSVNTSAIIPFTVPRYTVNFVDYNGTLLKTEKVLPNENATPPSNPSLSGHTFKGWNGSYTNITSNRTIIATYDINKYTVAFNSTGGTSVPTQTIEHGNKVTIPPNPKRGTDKFIGWYVDTSLKNKYDFNSTIASSFTLYARWDSIPTIQAPDLTILKNMYTNEEWTKIRLESVRGLDTEDGDISKKVIVIYDSTDLSKVGSYELTYQLTDSAGNTVTKKVKVNVLDDVLPEDKLNKYIRSISSSYLSTLKNSSVWKTNEVLSSTLQNTLNNPVMKSKWVLTPSDVEKIKEFNRTHDFSQESNTLFMQQFGHLRK